MIKRCFMLEPTSKSVEDLDEFGEITYIFNRSEERPPVFSSRFQAALAERLKVLKFDPLNDYFVLTGYMIGICVTVSVLARLHPTFEVLIFHQPTCSYSAVTMGPTANVEI